MSSRIALLCNASVFASVRQAALPAEHARKVGADALWLEGEGDGALLQTAAALAVHAEGLDLIISGLRLPARNLLREAEDLASLDGLCAGRLEVSLAWAPGVQAEHVAEEIAVLRDAWRPEPMEHAGVRHTFSGIDVHPKPERAGGPPLWIDARKTSGVTADFAGELDCGWVCEIPHDDDAVADDAATPIAGGCSRFAFSAGPLGTGAEPLHDARERLGRFSLQAHTSGRPPNQVGGSQQEIVGVVCDPALSV